MTSLSERPLRSMGNGGGGQTGQREVDGEKQEMMRESETVAA